MADLVTTYSLGAITFNNGLPGDGTDLYWIQSIRGLDGPTIRAPVDDVPYGDGGLVHKFWKGPRRVSFDGVIIIQTVPFGGSCQAALNAMESALATMLDGILQTPGTLTWGAHTLPVYYEVPLDIQPTENYALRSFSFGLVSADADPA